MATIIISIMELEVEQKVFKFVIVLNKTYFYWLFHPNRIVKTVWPSFRK